ITVFYFRDTRIDAFMFENISPYINSGRTNLMLSITFLGNPKFLIPANLLLILYFIIRKDNWLAITVAAVELSSLGLMSLLKNIIQRPRPDFPLVEGITNYSFPSGHAFMTVVFFGLITLFSISNNNKRKNTWIVSVMIILIFLIGFSRIYLRVHYATDVMAGWCIGSIWLITSLSILGIIKAKFNAEKIQGL
ncbi:MAG: phosphatase PAP2 family protein, partial [Chitinophagaceae bacterium]